MSFYTNFNKIITSPMLSTSLFLATGVAHTYKDYKNADDKYKNRFLIKDIVVLSGAASGIFLCANSSKYLGKLKPIQKFVENNAKKLLKKLPKNTQLTNKMETPLNYAKEIIENTMSNFGMFASGIFGALGADWVLGKIGFKQPKPKHLHEEKTQENILDTSLEKLVGDDIKNAIYERATDMPQLSMLHISSIGDNALDLSKEIESKERLKHTTSCLINNSLVPMLILSTASIFTQKLKPIYQIPIIFTSLVGGTLTFNKIKEFSIKQHIKQEKLRIFDLIKIKTSKEETKTVKS